MVIKSHEKVSEHLYKGCPISPPWVSHFQARSQNGAGGGIAPSCEACAPSCSSAEKKLKK